MGRFVSKIVCRGRNKDGFWINEFFGTLALNIIFIMRLDIFAVTIQRPAIVESGVSK